MPRVLHGIRRPAISRGATGYVCARFLLPLHTSFVCFVFSARPFADRDIYSKASQPAAVATGGSAVAAAGRVAVAEQGWVVVVVVVTVMRNLGDGLRRNQPSRCSVPSRPYQALVPAAAMGKSEGGSLVSPPRGGRQCERGVALALGKEGTESGVLDYV